MQYLEEKNVLRPIKQFDKTKFKSISFGIIKRNDQILGLTQSK